jgi:hypothetical protein
MILRRFNQKYYLIIVHIIKIMLFSKICQIIIAGKEENYDRFESRGEDLDRTH